MPQQSKKTEGDAARAFALLVFVAAVFVLASVVFAFSKGAAARLQSASGGAGNVATSDMVADAASKSSNTNQSVVARSFSAGSPLLADTVSLEGANSNSAGKFGALPSKREIVCWGDSMTQGVGADSQVEITLDNGSVFVDNCMSYPEVLSKLTGYSTYNFGVSGATSQEIAIMQGGIEPEYDLDYYGTIDYQVMELGQAHTGDILILGIGSNGGWDNDFDTLIAQYQAMIDHSGCTDYIIIGDTDDPGTSAADCYSWNYWDYGYGFYGDYSYDSYDSYGYGNYGSADSTSIPLTKWEQVLSDAFGDHFINMRVYLIEHGLEVAGLTATEEDEWYASEGYISPQLRYDWTHFNTYGYFAQAMGVYEKGLELGYW